MAKETKNKIIQAAVEIMAKEGIHTLTVRKIMEKAGVNIASINYHFGNKDALINQAMTFVTSELKQAFIIFNEIDDSPKEKLTKFFHAYTEIGQKYPGIIKNVFATLLMTDEALYGIMQIIKTGSQFIARTIGELRNSDDEQENYMRTIQTMSSLMYPIMLGKKLHEVMKIDYSDTVTRTRYIDIIIDDLTKSLGE